MGSFIVHFNIKMTLSGQETDHPNEQILALLLQELLQHFVKRPLVSSAPGWHPGAAGFRG